MAVLLLSSSVTAACTCNILGSPYYVNTTATISCSCDAGAERNKAYTLIWRNTTGVTVETDTGNTPPTSGTAFINTFIIPINARNGIWNTSLTVDGTFKTYKEFTVTNITAVTQLQYEDLTAIYNISLGRTAAVFTKVKTATQGYAINALCTVTVVSPYGNVWDVKQTATVGGDGHLAVNFDTRDWRYRDEPDGLYGYYYIECNCFSNCTAAHQGAGCCEGSTTRSMITSSQYADSAITYYIEDNRNPIADEAVPGYMLALFSIIAIFITLALTWRFELLSDTKQEKQNIIRVLFIWIGLWLVSLVLAIVNLSLEESLVSTDIRTLFTTLYDIDMYVNWIVSAFLIIYLLYNAVLYLNTAYGRKR